MYLMYVCTYGVQYSIQLISILPTKIFLIWCIFILSGGWVALLCLFQRCLAGGEVVCWALLAVPIADQNQRFPTLFSPMELICNLYR